MMDEPRQSLEDAGEVHDANPMDSDDIPKRQLILSIFAALDVVAALAKKKLHTRKPLPRTREQQASVPLTVYNEHIETGMQRYQQKLENDLENDPTCPSMDALWLVHTRANDLLQALESIHDSE